jgi:hypothetical protein
MVSPFSGYIPPPSGGSTNLSGLYYDYTFNGNGNDSSGNGYNLGVTGTPTYTTGENSLANGASVVSGVNYFDTGSTTVADQLTNLLVSIWIKTTQTTVAYANICGKWNGGGINSGIGWGFVEDYNETGDAGHVGLVFQGATAWAGAETTTSLSDGNWHSVVATAQWITNTYTGPGGAYTTNSVTIYVDGSLNSRDVTGTDGSAGTAFVNNYSNTGQFEVGNDPASEPFVGTNDDFILCTNINATVAQITGIYSRGAQ